MPLECAILKEEKDVQMAAFTSFITGGKNIWTSDEVWAARRADILRKADAGVFIDSHNFRKDMSKALDQESLRIPKK